MYVSLQPGAIALGSWSNLGQCVAYDPRDRSTRWTKELHVDPSSLGCSTIPHGHLRGSFDQTTEVGKHTALV